MVHNQANLFSGNNSNGRTPSVENLTNLDHLPPPPVYREATRLSNEDIRLAVTNIIQENTTKERKQSKNGIELRNVMKNGDHSGSGGNEEVPPPIPPHRTPVGSRPKSAMSIDRIDQPTRFVQTNFDLTKMLVTPMNFFQIKILSYFKQKKHP